MNLVILLGRAGSGKTTSAEYIKNTYKYEEVILAKPLKKMSSILYGFPYELLKGDTPKSRKDRETIKDPIWGRTGRESLQDLGDLIREHMDPQAFVKIAIRDIDELQKDKKNVVISDVRHWNEYNNFKDRYGNNVKFVFLYRDDKDLILNEEIQNTKHKSEWECLQIYELEKNNDNFYIFKNDESIDDLYLLFDKLLK